MSSRTLCRCVRFAVIIAAICGAVLFRTLNFIIAEVLADSYAYIIAWQIFITLSSLPCLGVLACMWAVSIAIARDSVFTLKTSMWIHRSALLLFINAGFVLAVNVIMFFLSHSSPEVVLVSIGVTFVFIALGLLAAVLSRYIAKAAELQEVSEGTI